MATEAQAQAMADYFDAMSRRDRERALAYLTDDFEAVTSAFVTGHRTWEGREGMSGWFDRIEAMRAEGEEVTLAPRSFVGDRSDPEVLCALVHVTISREGIEPLENDSAYVFRMRGNLAAGAHGYMDQAEAMAGLSEPYDIDWSPPGS